MTMHQCLNISSSVKNSAEEYLEDNPCYHGTEKIFMSNFSLGVQQSCSQVHSILGFRRKGGDDVKNHLKSSWKNTSPPPPTTPIYHIFWLILGRTERGRGSVCLSQKLNRWQNFLALLTRIFEFFLVRNKPAPCLEIPTCISFFFF